MKVKTIRIKIINKGFEDFKSAFVRTQQGKKPKSRGGVFFTSMEAVRRILTPERIKLLKYIKEQEPQSIYQLAKGLSKNFKNVSQDLEYLMEAGLIEMEETRGTRGQKRPALVSDHIRLELRL